MLASSWFLNNLLSKTFIGLVFVFLAFGFLLGGCSGNKKVGTHAEKKRLENCLKLSKQKKYVRAIECIEAFKGTNPLSQKSAQADITLADNYFASKDYLIAAEAYQNFVNSHPYHNKRPYALYRLGMAYLKESPKSIDRDQPHLAKAYQRFNQVVTYFPRSPYAKLAKKYRKIAFDRLARKEYYTARFYYKYHEYITAVYRFRNFLSLYSEHPLALDSYYYWSLSYKKLDKLEQARSIYKMMEKRYQNNPKTKSLAKKLKL